MTEFLLNQLFGLNGLVNLSNIVFLAAFSVRDVLFLRLLSIVAYLIILPFYYLQQETLWPSIFWGLTFITVNVVRVIILWLERRPVILSDEEQELHQLAFSSLDKREFLNLLSLAEWIDVHPGQVLIEKGKSVSSVLIMTSGQIEAALNDHIKVDFRPGQLIGTAEVLGGLGSPITATARAPARLAKWNVENVRAFAASRPELRAKLAAIVNVDLVGKLRQAAEILPGTR